MNKPPLFTVIVSNVRSLDDGAGPNGEHYYGDNEADARRIYAEEKQSSIDAIGAAAGEDVTLTYKGEPLEEYVGYIAQERTEADKAGCGNPHCTACKLRHLLEEELAKREAHKDGELGYIVDHFIKRIGKVKGIEVTEEQRAPLYEALINAITSNSNGG